ncbi:dicarboxylate/amino acid:cation symporter [Xiamenia xianingshaonis]|nr:dicarboxylate/amino acid:cation symporter [Xiamenia xianingshaonis]
MELSKMRQTTPPGSAPASRKKLGLTAQILLALVLGIVCGVVFYYLVPAGTIRDDVFVNGIFYVVGQGFIRLMQMLVVPLVFCSIVCGASAIDVKTLGSVGVKTLVFYLCTTLVAICIALCIGNLINPGLGVDMSAMVESDTSTLDTAADTSVTEVLLGIIPKNPIGALANGDMLAIIFFALFIGVVLAILGKRVETVHSFFAQFNDIMMEMTSLVMRAAPIGVFCLLARTFANIGLDVLLPMLKYIIAVVLALACQLFITYMVLLWVFARVNPITFLKKFVPVFAFAFSTASSNATIPLNIDTLESKMGVSRRISSFTIPFGATVNMDGTSIMQGVAVIFTAQLFGVELGPMEYATIIATATLASIGTAGVPSAALVMLSMIFNSIGLPLEGIALIMGIDRIVDMCRTAVNITGDAVVSAIVAKQAGEMDLAVFNDPEAGLEIDEKRVVVSPDE